MGRKKIRISKIESTKDRVITYCKRRYGLLKKAAELSILCDVGVYIVFTDINNNVYNFNSFRTDRDLGEPKASLSLSEVLNKVKESNYVRFTTQDYPFEGLQHHHNLDEFSRMDSFVDQISDKLGASDNLAKRKPEIDFPSETTPNDLKTSSKKELSLFLKKEQKKLRQSIPLMSSNSSVSILQAIKQFDEEDDFESNPGTISKKEIEKLLSEIKAKQVHFWNTQKFNLPRNDSSVIDIAIYCFLINTYFEAWLNEGKESHTVASKEASTRLLNIYPRKNMITLARDLDLESLVKKRDDLEIMKTLIEYCLRQFVNPHIGKSKQINYVLLNGLVAIARSFFQSIAYTLSGLYSESATDAERHFSSNKEIISKVFILLDVCLHCMLMTEMRRQDTIGNNSLISASLQDLAKHMDKTSLLSKKIGGSTNTSRTKAPFSSVTTGPEDLQGQVPGLSKGHTGARIFGMQETSLEEIAHKKSVFSGRYKDFGQQMQIFQESLIAPNGTQPRAHDDQMNLKHQ